MDEFNTRLSNTINNNNEIRLSSYNSKIVTFNYDLIIQKIIKNICTTDSKSKNKNKTQGIFYNTILLNTIKISLVNIPATNLIALGIFSKETKSAIIRIFLLNTIISYLNFEGDKNDFLNSKQFNDINKFNNKDDSIINYKLYDTFLSIPIQMHFQRIIKNIFKRQTLYIKDIYYKNYYVVDLDSDRIIFSLETLYDKNNGKEPEFKTSLKKELWKELLYHCHYLKNDYIKNNNMTFNVVDYQNFFVKVEFKVTYPRRNFIIKFLPLFQGMCIIHEYIQLKLSTFEVDEKKNYNEKNIIYGYDQYDNAFKNSDNRYFENEHYTLKQVHFFFVESLFCSNSNIYYFFTQSRKPKIYFSEEILEIIKKEMIKYINNESENQENNKNKNDDKVSKNNNNNDLINKIINILYEEYMQINTPKKKFFQKTPNIINQRESLIKKIESLDKKKSLQISKNETLIYLFYSIPYNKNINPNDITLDLNDERISQLSMNYNNSNDEESITSSRRSEKPQKQRPNSIRFSELLSEKISKRPSKETREVKRDSKFPYDTEIEEQQNENNINNDNNNINIKETEAPLKEEEYIDSHNIYGNEIINDNHINNINHIVNIRNESDIYNNGNMVDNEVINNEDINYDINDDNNYQIYYNEINNENMSDINYQNNVINTNFNIDDYTYNYNYQEQNIDSNIKNDKYFNVKVKKLEP